jgi:hypothetical protein
MEAVVVCVRVIHFDAGVVVVMCRAVKPSEDGGEERQSEGEYDGAHG